MPLHDEVEAIKNIAVLTTKKQLLNPAKVIKQLQNVNYFPLWKPKKNLEIYYWDNKLKYIQTIKI